MTIHDDITQVHLCDLMADNSDMRAYFRRKEYELLQERDFLAQIALEKVRDGVSMDNVLYYADGLEDFPTDWHWPRDFTQPFIRGTNADDEGFLVRKHKLTPSQVDALKYEVLARVLPKIEAKVYPDGTKAGYAHTNLFLDLCWSKDDTALEASVAKELKASDKAYEEYQRKLAEKGETGLTFVVPPPAVPPVPREDSDDTNLS